MKKLLLGAVAALLMMPMTAKADTFHMDSFSQPGGAQNITFDLGPIHRTVSAGEIDIHQNIPALDYLVWCLDISDFLVKPYTFQVNTFGPGSAIGALPGLPAGGLDAAQVRQIASLMLKGLTLGGADANQDDAATQLAIWSVEYGPSISFSGLSAPLAGRLALLLLDSANGGLIDCPTCSITLFTDAVEAPNQALGFAVNAVPGPVAGAGIPGVIAAGMFMVGLAKRRRQRNIVA
jgi:hypothetical protein